MTERMEAFRLRQQEKGLIQLRLWVKQEDEEFFKYLAKHSRPERQLVEKKRYGQPAKPAQIALAQQVAELRGLPEPKHLYNYNLSLWGWIQAYRFR